MQANDVDAFVDQGDGNGSSEQQSIKEKKKEQSVYWFDKQENQQD